MQRLFQFGRKLSPFNIPQNFHQVSRLRYSSEINSRVNEEPLIISRSLYTAENYLRIENLQEMPYRTLLEEAKKYPGKPKSRSKNAVIQFIVDHIPKKEQTYQHINHEPASFPEVENQSEWLGHSGVRETPAEGGANDARAAQNILNNSVVFKDLKYDLGTSQYDKFGLLSNKALPYIETYPPKQILEELDQRKPIDLRREIEQFVLRSSLYQKTSFPQKVKKYQKEDVKEPFTDLIFLHREYADFFRNNLKHMLTDHKGKYTTLDCLEILRHLDKFENLFKIQKYLQTLPSNALLDFWQTIFESINKYDLNSLDMILRMAFQLKDNYDLKFAEATETIEIYEKIISQALEIIQNSKENYSIVALAGLLNNSKVFATKVSPDAQQNIKTLNKILIKKYSEEMLEVDFTALPLNPKEMLTLGFAILSAEEDIPALRTDVFKKIRTAGAKYFDKIYVKELLIFLSNKKIVADKELIQDLRDNPKLTDSLDLFDIYLILHIFKEAQVDFSKIYIHLFFAFFSLVDTKTALPDMKSVLLCAKIMNHILENHMGEHRKATLEKKTSFLLMLLETSVDVMEEKVQVIDLIEVSSLFISHLNSPDFLFRKILLLLDDLVVTNENKNKLARFVNKFMDKIEPKYTFNTYLTHTDLEFNDKLSEFTSAIFKKLVAKFRESNLLTYIMLNIRIASNPQFLRAIYPDPKERASFIDYLVKQILGLTTNTTAVGVPHLKTILKFIFTNSKDINPNFMILMHQKLLPQFFAYFPKNTTIFNDMLEWLFYISNSLKQSNKEGLNPANIKVLEALVKKLGEFTVERVIQPFCENSSLTVQQIIYDRDVSQYFNPSVFNTNFENLEYLLPILDALEIPMSPLIERNIISQFPKCIKRWHGDKIVKNLLLLDRFQIHSPELFEFSIPNLFTCFTFYFDMQNLILNKDVISEQEVIQLLKAFVNQKEVKYFKEINKSIGQPHFTKQNATMIPLGAMLYKTMHLLAPEEIIKVLSILENERKNYMQAFIDKFRELDFKSLSFEKALELKTMIPPFLQNDSINKVIYESIEHENRDIQRLFAIMHKEKLWISDIIPKMIREISSTKSMTLLENFLAYLAQSALHLDNLSPIIELVKSFAPANLSEEAIKNFLTVYYIYEIQHPVPEGSKKTTMLSEKEESFKVLLCDTLLKSESFYYFVNEIEVDGKIHKLKYFGSFALTKDIMSNTFKVLPKNKTGSLDSFGNSQSENDLFVSQGGPSEENLFETSKSFGEDTIKEEFRTVAHKYLLYSKFHGLAQLPSVNEQLTAEFMDLQNKNFNLIKFKENFANFLIDVTLILHELGHLYKTNFECGTSHVLIDIALMDLKVAILFVDQQETICELKNGEKHYYPNNFHKMRADLLKQVGWNVIPVIYETWNAQLNTKEKKEYNLKKQIDAMTTTTNL